MAKKDSGNVTITLDRATVAMLRAKKKDLETWDELMLRLGGRRDFEMECVFCGAILKTKDVHTTMDMLARESGWEIVYSGRVEVSERNEIETKGELGYICSYCAKLHGRDVK